MLFVLDNFINNKRLKVKSNERNAALLSWQDSKPYSRIGMHFDLLKRDIKFLKKSLENDKAFLFLPSECVDKYVCSNYLSWREENFVV